MAIDNLVLRPKDMAFPLAEDQQQAYELYTSNTILGRLRRDFSYLRVNNGEASTLCKRTLASGGIGGVLGAAITYVAMKYYGEQDEETSEKPSTLKITGYGAAAGAGLMSILGASYTLSEMEQSQEYITWRDHAIQTKIFPLFQKFLQDSDQIRDYLCPILQDLISVPFKDSKGRVYERDAIFNWIDRVVPYTPEALARLPTEADRDRVRFRTSPFCDMVLRKEDLTYDMDYHRNVAMALKALFDGKVEQQFKEGLLNYQVSMVHDRERLLQSIVADLTTKHISGRIKEAEFIEACRDCRAHYSLAL